MVYDMTNYQTCDSFACTDNGLRNFQKYCFVFLSCALFTSTNIIDPDKMSHDAAFHLDLHCL